jgi:putative transposase
MNDELNARHRAITLRLAGRPVKAICAAVGRSEVWFHEWWGRYLQAGPEGRRIILLCAVSFQLSYGSCQ